MIELTPNIKTRFRDVFKIARRDRMRVVWLEPDLAYCARRTRGHDRYLVKFTVSSDGQVSVGCRATSGRVCEGGVFKGLCAHAAKVILSWEKKHRQRREQSEAA